MCMARSAVVPLGYRWRQHVDSVTGNSFLRAFSPEARHARCGTPLGLKPFHGRHRWREALMVSHGGAANQSALRHGSPYSLAWAL